MNGEEFYVPVIPIEIVGLWNKLQFAWKIMFFGWAIIYPGGDTSKPLKVTPGNMSSWFAYSFGFLFNRCITIVKKEDILKEVNCVQNMKMEMPYMIGHDPNSGLAIGEEQ